MATTPFSDAFLSLSWAEQEAGALKTEIDEFRETRPYSVEAKPYPDGTGGEILLEISGRPDLDAWSKRVGVSVDCLRAALNYAAYQIALIDCPAKADRVEFPIFDNPATFQVQNRVKDFAQPRYDLLEALQPYNGQTDELWWLHELARFHRHRLIRPVADKVDQVVDTYRITAGNPDDISAELIPVRRDPDGKFVIGRWSNANPELTHVEVQPNLSVQMVLADPLVVHEPLPVLLFKMAKLTREILVDLEATL